MSGEQAGVEQPQREGVVNPIHDRLLTTSEGDVMAVLKRTYVIYVCAVCGSDNIECSTQNDSLCGDCGNWMNVEAITVTPVEDGHPDAR